VTATFSYVLERHLKREEVIMPKKEIGRFKGEPVYRRANVVSCRTPENWMRIGRQVKAGQEPLKWVKQRAVTLDRRRAQELANQEGKDPIQQGLYAEWQTEVFRPPPIQDVGPYCQVGIRAFAYRFELNRVKSRRTRLETWICMFRPCYLKELCIYLVSLWQACN
jgi:hypothetical protein